MSTYHLENSILKITINSKGAELLSLYNKTTKLEYLWNANPDFWPKKSPVLFPIVGGLKNGEFSFEGKKYQMGRHGFARDNEYQVAQIDDTKITFTLQSNENTLAQYPFNFVFTVEYTIDENKLYCKYIVKNSDNKSMYFSVGAHPAFNIPLTEGTTYNDWFLQFSTNENCGIYPINANGLIETKSVPLFNNIDHLSLAKELFYKDALVFKELQSNKICIKSCVSTNGLIMQFDELPYFGIWAAKDANFVCLEPWCGLGDIENTTGDITTKEGINKLNAQETFERVWSVEMY